eukprot:scaffold113880_cov19-Tisochrysis_lutea.AAC.1
MVFTAQEITSVDEGPYICIWDSRACATGPDCPPSTPELVAAEGAVESVVQVQMMAAWGSFH